MKKLTRILCLVLAMLMLLSTSAFAITYRATPAVEDFSAFNYGLKNNAYDVFKNSSPTDANNYNLVDGRGWSYTNPTSSALHYKLKSGIVVGLAGKSMTDKALYSIPSSTSYANGSLKIHLNVGGVDYPSGTSVYEEAYGPDEETVSQTATFEFDLLTFGNYSSFKLYYYGLNSEKSDGYDADGQNVSLISSGVVPSAFKKNGVNTSQIKPLTTGKWQHIAVVKNKTTGGKTSWDMYIDGEHVGSATDDYGSRIPYKVYLDIKFGAISTNEDKTLNNYRTVIDNLSFSYGDTSGAYKVPALVTKENTNIRVNEETKTILIPYGTTVGELKRNTTLRNTTADRVRVYENNDKLTEIVYSTSATANTFMADSALLTEQTIVTAENETNNGYSYYTVSMTDSMTVKQDGETKLAAFYDLTKPIVFNYSESPAEASKRILLAAVYNANGKIVDIQTNEGGETDFAADEQGGLSVTIPVASLAGLENGSKVKAFVWDGFTKFQPVDVSYQSAELTYYDEFLADPEVCTWQDGKTAAVSVTIDDGHLSSAKKYNTLQKQYGVYSTQNMISSYLIADKTTGEWKTDDVEDWKKIFADGYMDVGNHSYAHSESKKYGSGDLTDEELAHDITYSRNLLEEMFPDSECLVFAVPYGSSSSKSKAEVKKEHIAQRNGPYGIAPKTPADMYAIPAKVYKYGTPVETMNGWLDSAIEQGGWLVPLLHKMGTDSTPDTSYNQKQASIESHFAYIQEKSNAGEVWSATMTQVVKYIYERDTAKATITQPENNAMVLTVTDEMADNEIFDYPLTVKVQVPAAWKNSVTTTQGGVTKTFPIKTEQDRKFVYVHVVPDGGNMTIAANN